MANDSSPIRLLDMHEAAYVATSTADDLTTERIPNLSVSFVSANGVHVQNPPIKIGLPRILVEHYFDQGAYGTIEATALKIGAQVKYMLKPGWHDVEPGSYTEHRVIGTVSSSDGNKGMYSTIRYKAG